MTEDTDKRQRWSGDVNSHSKWTVASEEVPGNHCVKRKKTEVWDAGSPRAPLRAVRAELRVAAHRSGLATQVRRTSHPVRERTAALQRLVR